MSEESKSKEVSSQVNWVAFKQQFFSSVFIAPENVTYANMRFDTAAPESELLKNFSAHGRALHAADRRDDSLFYFASTSTRPQESRVPRGLRRHSSRTPVLPAAFAGWQPLACGFRSSDSSCNLHLRQ